MSRRLHERAYAWGGGLSLLAVLAAAGAAEPPPVAAASGAPDFAEFRQMIDRPLFSSTRRPPVLADAPQENLDAKQLRDTWRLSGIVIDPQNRQLAIFSQREGDQRRQLEVGMTLVDEWRLQLIFRDRVLLGYAGTQVELLLREPPPIPVPGDAPAATDKKPDKPAAPATPATKTTPAQGAPATAAPPPPKG